jgi:hypothetical protein
LCGQKIKTNFKKAYAKQYQAEFFKNPWSNMQEKLDALSSMEEVYNHAQKYPESRTKKVLDDLGYTFTS